MSPASIRRAAERTFDLYAVYGISVGSNDELLGRLVEPMCPFERFVAFPRDPLVLRRTS